MCHLKLRGFTASLLIAVCIHLAAYSANTAEQPLANDKVQIVMRDEVIMDQPLIRMQDVAFVEGAAIALVERIKHLDLYELTSGEAIHISQSHVKIRLLLAGWNADQFEIAGSESVYIKPAKFEDRPASRSSQAEAVAASFIELEASIEDAIKNKVSEAFSIPPADVIVKLNGSTNRRELDQIKQFDPPSLQLELLGSGRDVLGGRRLRFTVSQEHEVLRVLNLFAETSMLVKTPVASAAIAAGEVFSQDNVAFQTNELKIPPRELFSESTLFGKTASRRIPVGAEISFTSIRSRIAGDSKQAEDVIKARDAVFVTAQVGSVTVRLNNATALQSGKPGDLIRVRNESSQNVVTCRIVAANQVEAIVHR